MIEEFIKLLDSMMECCKFETTVEDGCTYLSGANAIKIECVSVGVLLNSENQLNHEAMEQLKKLSNGRYFVTPNETSTPYSVSGYLHTPRGIIAFTWI